MAGALYERVLEKAREFDAGARISSITRRDADDGVLLRLATGKAESLDLVQSLRVSWPLATVSQVKNLMNGRTETQVLLPNESEQREIALALARQSTWQRPLRLLANGLMALLAIACVQRAVEISNGPSAGG
jgi:hypothetical protein